MVPMLPVARPRKLSKVPFVEMADGALQGVVSSGSDISRVYVSAITAGSHEASCSTNNNRPCGGGGVQCNHIWALVDEAVERFGLHRVARFLQVDLEESDTYGGALIRRMRPKPGPKVAARVFSRFLAHLTYLEVPATVEPLPELHWFPSGVGR
ncbi:hypothetical protein AB0J86_01795 [Micromonospora sp. NPDC049559]|uniref:hypothetical protein n=1 Tax=Micromonospora sp. NPDC049559 TaxID=3155923 RepID=UPI00342F79B6